MRSVRWPIVPYSEKSRIYYYFNLRREQDGATKTRKKEESETTPQHSTAIHTMMINVNVDLLESKLQLRGSNNDDAEFAAALKGECERLAQLVQEDQLRLELAAKALFGQTHQLANTTCADEIRSVHTAFATLQDLKQQNRQTVQDCLALQDYFTRNRTTLLAMAERADHQRSSGGGETPADASVRSHLPRAHLHSSLVCVVSDTFEGLRQAERNIMTQSNAGADAMWQAPSSFERTTTKYWVKDENLTKLMMTCAAEAPLLVYGKQGPLTSTKPQDLKTSDGDKLWDALATRITSIYFDSADMGLYRERLKRVEGAQLLRARWYGPVRPTGDEIIFVELKTHHEKWVANKSVKERALVRERDMVPFLQPVRWTREDAQAMILRAKPNMKADEIPRATGLLLRMHNLVVRHKLTACVRSVYDRAAFQSSTSNGTWVRRSGSAPLISSTPVCLTLVLVPGRFASDSRSSRDISGRTC